MRDRAGAEGVGLQRVGHGGGEFLRAVVIEEAEESRGVGPQRFSAGRQALEERRDGGDREPEAVTRTRRIGLPGRRDEAGEMRLVLDRLPGVVTAGVPRDL